MDDKTGLYLEGAKKDLKTLADWLDGPETPCPPPGVELLLHEIRNVCLRLDARIVATINTSR